MSRALHRLGARFRAPRAGARSSTRPPLRRSASLLPSIPPRRRSRIALAGIGLAAGAGLAGTVAVTSPAASFGAGTPRAVHGAATVPPAKPVSGLSSVQSRPAAAPNRASRSQRRAPLTRRVTRQVTRTVPVAPAFSGNASWYGPGFEGQPTASGATYDSSLLTAASKTLPLGTHLNVCHGGACVTVLVNDRGPYVGDRVLDLSRAAATDIGLVDAGVGYVTATPVETRQITEIVTETVPLPAATPQG